MQKAPIFVRSTKSVRSTINNNRSKCKNKTPCIRGWYHVTEKKRDTKVNIIE